MYDVAEQERKLWLTVLRQAQWDAEGKGEVEDYLIYRARKWLTRMTRSFLTVCSLAGMPATQAHYLQEQERLKYSCALGIVVATISRGTAALSRLVTKLVTPPTRKSTVVTSQSGTILEPLLATSSECTINETERPTGTCGSPFHIAVLVRG